MSVPGRTVRHIHSGGLRERLGQAEARVVELEKALVTVCARFAQPPPPVPPPQFVAAYNAPPGRRFQAVELPGSRIVVLDRDAKGARPAADVWADLARQFR